MANLMLLLVLSSISMASCLASYPPDGYRSRYHPPTYQTYDRRLIDSYNNVATTDAYPRKYEEPRSNSYTSTNHGSYSGRSYKNSYPNAGGIYQKAYNSLQSAYKPAQTTYTSVESAYKPAKTSYTSVGSAYKPAKTSYTSVGSAYKPAKTSYTSVESAYKPTKNTYTPLQSAYKPSHGAYKPAGSAYSQARSAYKQIKGHGKDYYGTAGKEYGGSSSYGSYQTRNTYSTPHGEYQAPRYQLNTPMSHTTYNMNDEYIESQAYRPESYDGECQSYMRIMVRFFMWGTLFLSNEQF